MAYATLGRSGGPEVLNRPMPEKTLPWEEFRCSCMSVMSLCTSGMVKKMLLVWCSK